MANRHHSARRLKRLRSYDVREAAKAIDATPATVRAWRKCGLQAVEGVYPPIFRGADLIAFLKSREAKRKRPCGPGRMFCFRCKQAKRPAYGEVEFWPDGPQLGTLMGLCPDCSGMMNRRVSLAKMKEAAGDLTVSMQRAEPRLGGMPSPSSNPSSEGV